MTLTDILDNGGFDELANRFADPANARILLTRVRFPAGQLPTSYTNSRSFWLDVCTQIDGGIEFEDGRAGFEPLFQAALTTFRRNRVFRRILDSAPVEVPAPPANIENGFTIVVGGWSDPTSLLREARTLARNQGLPEDCIDLGFSNVQGVFLDARSISSEQALSIARGLEQVGVERGQSVRVSVSATNFRDYMIGQLIVEGPDSARYEVSNIPASTPVRDVAQAIISEYDPKAFGPDKSGRAREVSVDKEMEDGSNERLDPNKTLHDHGIEEADTLRVQPKAHAGVHPQVREDALARAQRQIVEYARLHPGFEVEANAHQMPTEYLLRFRAASFAPPAVPGGMPIEIDRHAVFLALPPEFPIQAPVAFWQTPIFHPNIHPELGKVCLGLLEENYRPGLDFRELCQLLIDIAGFRNYAAEEGYDRPAQEWAVSPEGQLAIEELGGESVTRYLLRQVLSYEPPPLQIKRVDG